MVELHQMRRGQGCSRTPSGYRAPQSALEAYASVLVRPFDSHAPPGQKETTMTGWKSTLAAALLGCAALNAGATTLNVTPVPNPSTVGQVITLTVSVADVWNMAGFHFSVNFNPAVVNASFSHVETFLLDGGQAFLSPGGIDNSVGEVKWISGLLVGPAITPFSGSTPLAEITFTAVGAGNAGIWLSDVELQDIAYQPIPYTMTVSPLQVNAVAAVPEPATWMMLGAGLAGLAALRRRTA